MRRAVPLALVVLLACENYAEDRTEAIATDGTLRLVREQKLSKLVAGFRSLEASGVVVHEGSFVVVFDGTTRIATIGSGLDVASVSPWNGREEGSQYEAVTAAPGRFFVSVEGSPARIAELDVNAYVLGAAPANLVFTTANKGVEGLAWLGDEGGDRLLALSETDGAMSILVRDGARWTVESSLARAAPFADFSDVAVLRHADGTYLLAVLSQESSAVWVGTLLRAPWRLGTGQVLTLPREGGALRYCNAEGVSFLDERTIVVVSDKTDNDNCRSKDESIHVFALP